MTHIEIELDTVGTAKPLTPPRPMSASSAAFNKMEARLRDKSPGLELGYCHYFVPRPWADLESRE